MKSYWTYRTQLDFKHRMRDPIYGFIQLTQVELDIIDTPIFQRLRRVHQLALTKYVYPSAEHSRFVHSIGVMHCATLIYEGIWNHKATSDSMLPTKRTFQTLRLAALLHDIGHLPFSHAAEETLLPEGIKHEHISSYIILHYDEISEKIISAGCKPAEVAMLLEKAPRKSMRVEHDIISGNLDADRADYLLRDSHACGVCYGIYDFSRFLHMFAAIEDEDDNHFHLCVGENDLWLAESLLITRYHYNLQVPYHRTRSGFDIALRQFIKNIKLPSCISGDEGVISTMNFDDFVNFDDYSIMEQAKTSSDSWAKYLLRKEHLCLLLDTTSHINGGTEYFTAIKCLKTAQLNDGIDFFIQESPITILKDSSVIAEDSEKAEGDELTKKQTPYGGISLLCKDNKTKADICDRSWIFSQFTDKPLTIYRIYTTIEKKERIACAIKGVRNG